MNCIICTKPLLKRQKNYCSNACKFSDKTYNCRRVSLLKNDETKILVSKLDGWKTKDINNKSGIITRYLTKQGISVDNYIQHFDTEIVEAKPLLNCPYCDWTSQDINNVSGVFTRHISSHNKTISNVIEEYPDYKRLWKTFQNSVTRVDHINYSDSNHISCKICDEKLKEITNSHLKKHDITCEEYKEKYGELVSENTKKEFSKNLSEIEFDSSSKAEREVRDYLLAISPNSKFLYNTKKILHNIELDIYCEDKKIGIEYNGLYFHSEMAGGKMKDYHLFKTNVSEKNGIKLIQIFEDEWRDKPDIVKNRLNNLFGIYTKKLNARDLKIENISNKQKSEFLNLNHLQGNDKSNIMMGLFDGNMLVSVITFSKPRVALGIKNYENDSWELVRFCNLNGYNVRGGFSKLLSHFIKTNNPKKIITYADRRWSSKINNVYEKNKFVFVSETKPNYFYMQKYKTRLHRYNFTKSKLVKKFGLPESMTEPEIMRKLRYDRIWDCGHLKYEMNIS